MQLKLITTNKTSQQSSEVLLEIEDKVVVGRHLTSPVLLQGEAISRQHLSIALKDEQLTVENLSPNGTVLNGLQLPANESAPLITGDILELPGYEIRVEIPPEDSEEESNAAAGSEAAKVPAWQKVLQAAVNFFDPLEVLLVICALAIIVLTTYYITS
jgi:predicted component of type VI protein secretion system